jgi:hypothetical protein
LSAAGALAVAIVLAGCGQTTFFAGRQLPPSQLTTRVLIAVQNPSALTRGALEIVDAFYDTRYKFNSITVTYSISGFSGALPLSIQNMPEEQLGAVYGSGDGSFTYVNYAKETSIGAAKGLAGTSSSIFGTRNGTYVFAAQQGPEVLSVANQATGASVPLGLPGVYRVSANPGGSMAIAFVQNSNFAYYPRQLNAAQTIAYSGGSNTWPKAAVDCEPQNAPLWCLFQMQSPDAIDGTGNYYGAPLAFNRPVKAVFSEDGGTAYILSCGPECGGTAASVSLLPVSPMIFLTGQQSGLLPCNAAPCANANTKPFTTIPIPGGSSNALVTSSTMYVAGQQLTSAGLFTGNLTTVNLTNNTVGSPISISDGEAGAVSRMLLGDDNTLWIGMTKCNNGERYAIGQPDGCLTMYNTSTGNVLLQPYAGDATGIAAVTGLHKIYTVEGGQVYIFSTECTSTECPSINNQYVTVTGTAYDVAFIDATTDSNNTVY